jgi:hypothetical protein
MYVFAFEINSSKIAMSSFYALVGSAECQGIQILTIRYFNSFGLFWDTLCIGAGFHQAPCQFSDILFMHKS